MHYFRLLIAALIIAASTAVRAELPTTPLSIAGNAITAEVAANNPDRMQGLMNRRMMPESRGMVFVFTEVARHAMWMKNTFIPLSVAFIDEKGVITNIEDMQPHTETAHGAVRPARYALEMNLGWFKKRKIGPGTKVEGLEKLPAPQ